MDLIFFLRGGEIWSKFPLKIVPSMCQMDLSKLVKFAVIKIIWTKSLTKKGIRIGVGLQSRLSYIDRHKMAIFLLSLVNIRIFKCTRCKLPCQVIITFIVHNNLNPELRRLLFCLDFLKGKHSLFFSIIKLKSVGKKWKFS